jgi:hypothetical protein
MYKESFRSVHVRLLRVFFRSLSEIYMGLGLHRILLTYRILFMYRCSSLETTSEHIVLVPF